MTGDDRVAFYWWFSGNGKRQCHQPGSGKRYGCRDETYIQTPGGSWQDAAVQKRWVFAVITGVVGVFMLGYFFNWLSAGLAAFSLFLYAFMYTPLKKVNAIAVLVGAFPGALPCLIGWAAGNDAIFENGHGWKDYGGWILFGIQFLWQFPISGLLPGLRTRIIPRRDLNCCQRKRVRQSSRLSRRYVCTVADTSERAALCDRTFRYVRHGVCNDRQSFPGLAMCPALQGNGCKGSEKGDVQQLYLPAGSIAGDAGG